MLMNSIDKGVFLNNLCTGAHKYTSGDDARPDGESIRIVLSLFAKDCKNLWFLQSYTKASSKQLNQQPTYNIVQQPDHAATD